MENERTGPSISNSTTGVSCSVLNQGPHSTFTVNATDPSAKQRTTEADVFWFEVEDPVESFHGRVEFLHRLHSSIQEGGETVLSQSKIIGGLGGVGKTETARKYIQMYKNDYKNVIWINAETKTSMEDSFKRLALELSPKSEAAMKIKAIQEIVRECYKIICQRKSLVVFDNAQFHTDSTFGSDDGMQQFMPGSLEPTWKRPFFLITSRNLDWVSLTSQLLELDMLEEDECFDFIKKELSFTLEVNESDARELGRVLGGLPLALTQAVAYIREKCRKKQLSGFTFTLSDYLKEFGQTQEQSLNYLPRDSKTKVTVVTTWSVTLNLMETFDGGESAIWLSQVLSILSPDGVPVFFLRTIVKKKMEQDKFGESMDILRRYAFVKYSDDQRSVNIHRLVQFIILEQLQKKGELEKLLEFLVGSCKEFVPRHQFEFGKLKDVQMTNSLCVVDKLRLVTPKSEFLLFQLQLAREYRLMFKYDQALSVLKEVDARLDQKANKIIQCIIKLESAVVLNRQRKFEECDSMLKTVCDLLPNHLEPDDPDVPEMMDERLKSCVLAQEGKRQEALKLTNQICEKKLRCWRSNNVYLFQSFSDLYMPSFYRFRHNKWNARNVPGSQKMYQKWDELLERAVDYGLQIQNCVICTETNSIDILESLANIHESQDRNEKALEMPTKWYKEKEKILPADDPSLIQMLAHMVRHNLSIERSDVSEDMSKILHEKLMTIKRPHHPYVLSSMMNFVISLKKQKMYKESLDVCGVLCEDGEVVWGPYDSRVLWSMEELAKKFQYLDRHEEAVEVLKIVDERKCKDFQQYELFDVANTKHLYADALSKCGKFQESLEIFEVVRKIYEKIFHPSDIGVSKVLEDMSDVLWSLKRFDESISILKDLSLRLTNKYKLADPYKMAVQKKLATRKEFLRQKDKKGKECRLV